MQNTKAPALPLSVARTILADVADGRLKPGARVIEQAYSARCGVSRTPVREALSLLSRHGVLEQAARHGACVRSTPVAARKLLARKPFAGKAAERTPTEPAFVELTGRIRALLHDPQALPDAILKDTAFARTLGVSRTTANRALSGLAREGLLEPLPRRGWRRVRLGPQAYLDWYEYRMALEPAALRAAWMQLDRPALAALRERTAHAATPRGLAALTAPARIDLDLALHRAILEACANPFLKRAMQQAEAQLPVYMALMPSWHVPSRAEATFREHMEILDAIFRDQPAAAEAALRKHLLNARKHLARGMRAPVSNPGSEA